MILKLILPAYYYLSLLQHHCDLLKEIMKYYKLVYIERDSFSRLNSAEEEIPTTSFLSIGYGIFYSSLCRNSDIALTSAKRAD